MTRVVSSPTGSGRTRIVHTPTGTEITTAVSPEFGGTGGAFSSTDLVSAALGSCISSSLEPLLLRHGVALEAAQVIVDKELATDPKRISRLAVQVTIATAADERLATILERAAHTCTVHRSLHPDIDSPVEIVFTG